MKRKLNYFGITAAAAALMLASCSQELEQVTPITDGDVDVTCVVSPEGLNEVTTYSVDAMKAAGYKMRYVMEVYSLDMTDDSGTALTVAKNASEIKVKRMVKYEEPSTSTVTFEYRVPQGNYANMVWVDYVTSQGSNTDDTSDDAGASYEVSALYNIAITDTYKADAAIADAANTIGTEYRDAFYYYNKKDVITGLTDTQSITATRAVSRVNLVTSDISELAYTIDDVTMTYKNNVTGFNVSSGVLTSDTSADYKTTYSYTTNPANDATTSTAIILSDYMLSNYTTTATGAITEVKIETSFENRTSTHAIDSSLSPSLASVPLAMNTQTNIMGSLLTTQVDAVVSLDDSWSTTTNDVNLGTTTAPNTNSLIKGMTATNPADANGGVAINSGTITIPATKASDIAYDAYVIPQNGAEVGAGADGTENIIKSIELVATGEVTDAGASYDVMVTLNQNYTAYIRQVALQIYYTMSAQPYIKDDKTTYTYTNAKSYTQTLYQAPSYGSGTTAPQLQYFSNVKAKGYTGTVPALVDLGKYNSTYKYTPSLVDNTEENYQIVEMYGEYDQSANKYYTYFDVVVKTKRNPSSLKIYSVTPDGYAALNNAVTILDSNAPTVITSATSDFTAVDDYTSWDGVNAQFLKYSIRVQSNIARDFANDDAQYFILKFKDYSELKAGVAKPTAGYSAANTVYNTASLDYIRNSADDSGKVPYINVHFNPLYLSVDNDDDTVEYAEYDDDGAYFPAEGKEFTVKVTTNYKFDTTNITNPEIAAADDVYSVMTTTNQGKLDILSANLMEDGDDKTLLNRDVYEVVYKLLPYYGTDNSNDAAYKLYAKNEKTGAMVTAVNKEIFQCGNYHALSQVVVADYSYDGTTANKNGYHKGNGAYTYSTIPNNKTIDSAGGTHTFYVRSNLVTKANDLLALITQTVTNNQEDVDDEATYIISTKENADVSYVKEYSTVFNFDGDHTVFAVTVNLPKNEHTKAKKYTFTFPYDIISGYDEDNAPIVESTMTPSFAITVNYQQTAE